MDRTFKALYFLGMLAEIAIRLPHERRRRGQRVAVGRVSGMEQSLLGLMFLGMLFVPAVHTLTPGWTGRTTACRRKPGGVPVGSALWS